MIAPAMTAIALVLFAGQQATVALQAVTEADVAAEQPATVPVETGVNLDAELEQPIVPALESQGVVDETAGLDTPSENAALPENTIPAALPETSASPTSTVDTAPAAMDSATRDEILSRAAAALTAAKTAQGKFLQVNADGSQSTGDFALRRPGKMRFDYDDPTPILIVSDGTTVAMEDTELETIDRIPLGSTPLGLLLDDALAFGSDVDVLRVNQSESEAWITVSDPSGEMEGELTMIFDSANYDLRGWLTLDANSQMTTVELSDVTTNGHINPRLFRLDEARDEEDER